jgi:transcriptional regulator with XRE-family HTH domain
MNRTPRQDLVDRLKDPEYAKLYGAENAKVDFAITLAKARKSADLTQKGLSEKLGISQPYVARLEGGEANPTLGTVGILLAMLGYRLVTQTAPLSPQPMPPAIEFMEATDVGANVFVPVGTPHGADYGGIPFPAVGPMKDLVPGRKADYPSRVAVAGGTV